MSVNQLSQENPPISVAAVMDVMPPVRSAEEASGLRMPSASMTARPARPFWPMPIAASASR